jgi:hypothetical protein
MIQKASLDVPFTAYTVANCMCPTCPVQAKSKCAQDQLAQFGQAVCNTKPMKKEQTPTSYCSTGKATCTDLNLSLPCICMSCAIYSENKLGKGEPTAHYCRNGNAREK